MPRKRLDPKEFLKPVVPKNNSKEELLRCLNEILGDIEKRKEHIKEPCSMVGIDEKDLGKWLSDKKNFTSFQRKFLAAGQTEIAKHTKKMKEAGLTVSEPATTKLKKGKKRKGWVPL